MRHLYARNTEPGAAAAIEEAKTSYERRRCGHHPDQYPEPLSGLECIRSVVDPKSTGANKHRYVCAVNDDELRASLREVAGVPLLYIRRSVMTLEPMAEVSAKARSREERGKFRAEIKKVVAGGGAGEKKRKRADGDDEDDEDSDDSQDEKDKKAAGNSNGNPDAKKRKKAYGQKLPNPLSIKKKKPQPSEGSGAASAGDTKNTAGTTQQQPSGNGESGEAAKKKRKRRPRTKSSTSGGAAEGSSVLESSAQVEAAA